jgi:hypothetical protein
LQGFLLQIDEAQVVVHEADEPDTVVDTDSGVSPGIILVYVVAPCSVTLFAFKIDLNTMSVSLRSWGAFAGFRRVGSGSRTS